MDDALSLAVGLLPALLVVGLATWAVTRACSVEGSTPDPLVGIRTRATKSSPDAWVRGHRAALPLARTGGRLSLLFTAAVLAAVVVASGGLVSTTLAAVFAVVGFLAVVGTCLAAAVVADRAARRR